MSTPGAPALPALYSTHTRHVQPTDTSTDTEKPDMGIKAQHTPSATEPMDSDYTSHDPLHLDNFTVPGVLHFIDFEPVLCTMTINWNLI